MNLYDLRAEVLAHGFDQNTFGSRINGYINDAYSTVCRRVDYYVDEATSDFQTTTGTAKYPLPANFARVRELWDTTRNVAIEPTGLRDIDQAAQPAQGPPAYYALDQANVHLFPNPDGVYSLELRYWLMPAPLVTDTDVPTLPADYHRMLCEYAIGRCFWGDDDPSTGQLWDQKFAMSLAEFSADVKFPGTEYPSVAKSMWDQGASLNRRGWSVFGW